MASWQNPWRAGLAAGVLTALAAGGCGGSGGPPAAPTTTSAALTTAIAGRTVMAGSHLVREARPADLNYEIIFVGRGPDGFPDLATLLRNTTREELIVPYGPMSVVTHVVTNAAADAGPATGGSADRSAAAAYARVGKDRGFPVRRFLLAPGETLAVEPPAGNWGQMSGGGEFDLMRPARLPPGRYRVWATFALRPARGGRDAEVVESNRREYEVH